MVLTEGNAAAFGIGFGVAGHDMFVWRGKMSKRRSIWSTSGIPLPSVANVTIVKRAARILLADVNVMEYRILKMNRREGCYDC